VKGGERKGSAATGKELKDSPLIHPVLFAQASSCNWERIESEKGGYLASGGEAVAATGKELKAEGRGAEPPPQNLLAATGKELKASSAFRTKWAVA
jgi:hypothetical protein